MESLTLLGVEVNPFTISQLNNLITQAVIHNKKWIIANHNLHSIYLYHREPEMRQIYALAKVIHIDSMPLLQWGKLLGYPLEKDQRVTYVDWLSPLLSLAEKQNWRVYYLGGKPGVAATAAGMLKKNFPGLTVQTYHGYFQKNGSENEKVIEAIRSFHPHILMVGMGMPIQEKWIVQNLDQLSVNVILTVGACFDYIAGAIPSPPRWMGRMGLEWLYRLISEPGRLWRRYLVEPWFLLPFLINDIFRQLHKKRQF